MPTDMNCGSESIHSCQGSRKRGIVRGYFLFSYTHSIHKSKQEGNKHDVCLHGVHQGFIQDFLVGERGSLCMHCKCK